MKTKLSSNSAKPQTINLEAYYCDMRGPVSNRHSILINWKHPGFEHEVIVHYDQTEVTTLTFPSALLNSSMSQRVMLDQSQHAIPPTPQFGAPIEATIEIKATPTLMQGPSPTYTTNIICVTEIEQHEPPKNTPLTSQAILSKKEMP